MWTETLYLQNGVNVFIEFSLWEWEIASVTYHLYNLKRQMTKKQESVFVIFVSFCRKLTNNLNVWSHFQSKNVKHLCVPASQTGTICCIFLSYVNVNCWTDKTRASSSAPRTSDGHFSLFWHFRDEIIKRLMAYR